MKAEFTLEELAESVREWCEEHRISPANGQASQEISERTIRYYRTIGLLDAALGSYVKSFTAKHRLQLIAIRIYQAQGIPLRKIREELYGQDVPELEALVARVEREGKAGVQLNAPFEPTAGGENWAMVPLNRNFILISRDGRELPRVVIEKINRLIGSAEPAPTFTNKLNQN